MRRNIYRSKKDMVYLACVAIGFALWAGDFIHRPVGDLLVAFGIFAVLLSVVYVSTVFTYLEIRDGRTLINSGYRSIGEDTIDIFDIKYIYRFPNFVLSWYGSRMVFYIKMADGKLQQSSLREVNYSNETLRTFLKQIKKIKPSIELDPEYEKFLEEKLYLEDASQNTATSVEARLKEKGESW